MAHLRYDPYSNASLSGSESRQGSLSSQGEDDSQDGGGYASSDDEINSAEEFGRSVKNNNWPTDEVGAVIPLILA